MKSKLENIMIEIIETKKCYDRTDNLEVKEHYDKYINILIENDVSNELKEGLHKYWESLK